MPTASAGRYVASADRPPPWTTLHRCQNRRAPLIEATSVFGLPEPPLNHPLDVECCDLDLAHLRLRLLASGVSASHTIADLYRAVTRQRLLVTVCFSAWSAPVGATEPQLATVLNRPRSVGPQEVQTPCRRAIHACRACNFGRLARDWNHGQLSRHSPQRPAEALSGPGVEMKHGPRRPVFA